MGLDRNLRRQHKKNGPGNPLAGLGQVAGQLKAALGDLKRVSDLGEAAEGLPGLLVELRTSVARAEERGVELQTELARQRAVFLRFFACGEGDTSFSPGADMFVKFLSVEERYRSEYDAMGALVKLLSWAKEAS